jgi:hypothetical protein
MVKNNSEKGKIASRFFRALARLFHYKKAIISASMIMYLITYYLLFFIVLIEFLFLLPHLLSYFIYLVISYFLFSLSTCLPFIFPDPSCSVLTFLQMSTFSVYGTKKENVRRVWGRGAGEGGGGGAAPPPPPKKVDRPEWEPDDVLERGEREAGSQMVCLRNEVLNKGGGER